MLKLKTFFFFFCKKKLKKRIMWTRTDSKRKRNWPRILRTKTWKMKWGKQKISRVSHWKLIFPVRFTFSHRVQCVLVQFASSSDIIFFWSFSFSLHLLFYFLFPFWLNLEIVFYLHLHDSSRVNCKWGNWKFNSRKLHITQKSRSIAAKKSRKKISKS